MVEWHIALSEIHLVFWPTPLPASISVLALDIYKTDDEHITNWTGQHSEQPE